MLRSQEGRDERKDEGRRTTASYETLPMEVLTHLLDETPDEVLPTLLRSDAVLWRYVESRSPGTEIRKRSEWIRAKTRFLSLVSFLSPRGSRAGLIGTWYDFLSYIDSPLLHDDLLTEAVERLRRVPFQRNVEVQTTTLRGETKSFVNPGSRELEIADAVEMSLEIECRTKDDSSAGRYVHPLRKAIARDLKTFLERTFARVTVEIDQLIDVVGKKGVRSMVTAVKVVG